MTKRYPHSRSADRLKDEVYREMFLLESKRPGSEMGLALALLRATLLSTSLRRPGEFRKWLQTVCPIGLKMIEESLNQELQCKLAGRRH